MDEEWSRNAKLDETKEDDALGFCEGMFSLSAPQNLATWKNLMIEVSWSCVHKSAQWELSRLKYMYVYSMRRVSLGKSFLHNNVQLCQFLSLVKFCEMWTWVSCVEWFRMIWLHTSLPYLFLPFCCYQGHHFLELNLSASWKVTSHYANQSRKQIRHSRPRLLPRACERDPWRNRDHYSEHIISCKLNPLFGFLASSGPMSAVIESSGSLISIGLSFCQ